MTIKDVAKYSGVSITTISRVLNNHPDVKEEVRARVWAAINELHYVPNSSARDLGKTQTNTIGVIVRGVGNPFLNSVLRAIEKAAAKAEFTLVMHQIATSDDELAEGASLIRSKRLKGIIFLGGRFDYTPQEVAALGVPFVCCTYTNSFGSLDKNSYSSVYIDDYAEAYRAVKMLTDKGHKKIAVLLGATNDRSISELRYKGYRDALNDAGLELDQELVVETAGFDMGDAYSATTDLISKRRDFTALFSIADAMGIAAMKALSDGGMKVPDDCSVIAIDGIEVSKYTIPTLTTLVQPCEEIGKQTVKILLDVLKGKKTGSQIRVDTVFREGETLAETVN